jgi:hypothetical protein
MKDAARFHPLFESWARRVRARLLARASLTGLALGLALAIVPSFIAWRTGRGSLRPWCLVGGAVGAAAGLAFAQRKRWSDVEVALWLDDRLAAAEAITTAVELCNGAEDDEEARAVVVSTAAAVLATEERRRADPRVLRPRHAIAPIAVAALVGLARWPLPPALVPPAAPGRATVTVADAAGLERAAALGGANARDDEQRERLAQIARDAAKLRADLEKGLERREALDRIARLRDAIAAERLTLGDGERRAGLEAAISKLEESAATKGAARALGDHDLEKMDREMERIANLREKQDRDVAKRALEEAAAAAKAHGAPDVGRALEKESQALRDRERRAELLRDLEKALDEAGEATSEERSEAEALDRKGSDEAARRLADSLGKALEKMTPEARQRLAEKLKDRARSHGRGQVDPRALKDLADDLSSPEGQKRLEKELEDMAREDDESSESKEQRQLDDAERGADGAEDDVNGQGPGGKSPPGAHPGEKGPGKNGGEKGNGGEPGAAPGDGTAGGPGESTPIPLPGTGEGRGGEGDGRPGAGGHHDTGTGSHEGKTNPVEGAGNLKSRAHAPMNRGALMPGITTGWSAGKAGGTANAQGTGALGSVGPTEVDGVEQSDVPEEYREQIRQYFQP